MGQCYDVNLKVRFKDENKVRQTLFAKIGRGESERVLYDMQGLEMRGFNFENTWDLMSVFFCGWGDKLKETADKGWLYSCFDASYGWEDVMMDAFSLIAPFLEDGSEIKIYPDSGCDHGKVYAGKVKWLS